MALMIPNAHVDRAAYIIDTSQAHELLQEALNLKPQGQRRQLSLRTWLIGAYLAVDNAASYKTVTIHEVLTEAISIEKQHALGTRFVNDDGDVEIVDKNRFDYIPRTLTRRLAYTPASAKKFNLLTNPAELARRRELVEQAVAGIIAASLVTEGTGWFALDGTGTWSWSRSKFVVKDEHDVREGEDVVDEDAPELDRVTDEVADGHVDEAADAVADTDVLPTGQTKPSRKSVTNYDPDAAVGSKTSKGGKRESYFGYVVDAAVRIAPPGAPKQPLVLEALVLSPASTDVVAPTLKLLDVLLGTTGGVTNIVVDRHYSFKKVERWADELRARGISQHFDLRDKEEQGFKDINSMRLAAGWMHCPATPDDLGTIKRPGLGASEADKEEFRRRIEERFSWAMDRHERVNAKGRTRWKCPAVAGKRGCPLREGTVEAAKLRGLPIVANPPDAAVAKECCTNPGGITSDSSDAMRKHQQPHYWGSEEWQIAYDLRTYVEGFFGSLKNGDTEGVRRGFTKFRGLPMMSLGLALAAAACNVRHQRNFWSDDPTAPDHPLLAPDQKRHGWRELDEDEATAEDDRYRDDDAWKKAA